MDVSEELERRFGASAVELRWDGTSDILAWIMGEFLVILRDELSHMAPANVQAIHEIIFGRFVSAQKWPSEYDEIEQLWRTWKLIIAEDGSFTFREWLRAQTDLYM